MNRIGPHMVPLPESLHPHFAALSSLSKILEFQISDKFLSNQNEVLSSGKRMACSRWSKTGPPVPLEPHNQRGFLKVCTVLQCTSGPIVVIGAITTSLYIILYLP